MRILDELGNELENYDESRGYVKLEIIKCHVEVVEGKEEIGHYKVLREYPNGGKDIEWVVDEEGIEAVPEHDEEEEIYRYIPYTESELAAFEISRLKNYLTSTDYTVIKCMERGLSVADTYPEVYQKREEARERINELEVLAAANEEDK